MTRVEEMYYIRDGGIVKGPLTLEYLRDLKLGGEISAWAECRKGDGVWGNILHIAPAACVPAPTDDEPVEPVKLRRPVMKGDVSPGWIVALSVFFPGLGHLITGRTRRGMLIAIVPWVLRIGFLLLLAPLSLLSPVKLSFAWVIVYAIFGLALVLGFIAHLFDAWKGAIEMQEESCPQPPAIPRLVAVLSLMTPGLGHFYSRRFKSGFILFVVLGWAYRWMGTAFAHALYVTIFAHQVGGVYTTDDKSVIVKLFVVAAVVLIAHAFVIFESFEDAVRARANYRPPTLPTFDDQSEDAELAISR